MACRHKKKGIDHSERLEENLNLLIPDEFKKRLKPAEIFILLYAVYLHDIGYRNEKGDIEANGHLSRSKKYILEDPDKYLFGPFRIQGREIQIAKVVADVCYGHAHEKICPLCSILNDDGDACLCSYSFNPRRVTALLRLADETDQAYIRLGSIEDTSRLFHKFAVSDW